MNKIAFALAFNGAVEAALQRAEETTGLALDRDVIVKMYGAGINGHEVSPNEFIDRAYINEHIFYRLIDVMVVELIGTRPVVFARISDHSPSKISECWNGEKGPFKVLIAESIAQK